MITPTEMEDRIIELAAELDDVPSAVEYFDGITIVEMIRQAHGKEK